jgi:hypothetical protein
VSAEWRQRALDAEREVARLKRVAADWQAVAQENAAEARKQRSARRIAEKAGDELFMRLREIESQIAAMDA